MPKIPERNIKTRKVVLKQDSRDRKTKGHHEKAEGQDQKASVLHGKDQAQPSKTSWFSFPLPLHSKNTNRLSLKTSPLFATSSLVLSQTSLPRTKSIQSYAQDTRLRVCMRSRSQRICHFCLHPSPHPTTNCISVAWVWRQTLHSPSPSPSPQQSEKQHVARLPLQKNGEGKRVKPSHVTHNRSTIYTQKVKRWRQK